VRANVGLDSLGSGTHASSGVCAYGDVSVVATDPSAWTRVTYLFGASEKDGAVKVREEIAASELWTRLGCA
jgi:hypothetical protein